MTFRPGNFRRATALLTAVSHLALIGCSSTPEPQDTAVVTLPPAEWESFSLEKPDLAEIVRKATKRQPVVPDIRGFYVGQTRCGANPISIEALILGETPDSIRGVASLSDPTTPTDTFFVIYEFRGTFDGSDVGLRPARLLTSSGLPVPGDLIGVPTDGDGIQSRFEGLTASCRPFTLQPTQKVTWDEAQRLQENFGEVVASFLPSSRAQPTARERSTPPPPVVSAPSKRTLSPEVQEQIQQAMRSAPSSSGNEFFAPPSQAPATSWVPSWMTRENVNKYGGYVAAGAALFLGGVLAYKYGGSSGTASSSASSSGPEPVTSSDASDRLLQQQEEERQRLEEARRQQDTGSGLYVPPVGGLYDEPNWGGSTPGTP